MKRAGDKHSLVDIESFLFVASKGKCDISMFIRAVRATVNRYHRGGPNNNSEMFRDSEKVLSALERGSTLTGIERYNDLFNIGIDWNIGDNIYDDWQGINSIWRVVSKELGADNIHIYMKKKIDPEAQESVGAFFNQSSDMDTSKI